MNPSSFIIDIDLDRRSTTPLYMQITDAITQRINEGALPPGARLENEIALAQRLRVSRLTARQALQQLVDRGLLKRQRGVGTVVSPAPIRRPVDLTSLYADLLTEGHEVTTSVLEYEEHAATANDAEVLGTEVGVPVVSMLRLRSADGQPLALMANLLPAAIAPSPQELTTAGLYDLLREREIVPVTADQIVGARAASPEEAATLGVQEGTALLTAARTSYDEEDQIVEFGNHLYRADRYSVTTTLFAS